MRADPRRRNQMIRPKWLRQGGSMIIINEKQNPMIIGGEWSKGDNPGKFGVTEIRGFKKTITGWSIIISEFKNNLIEEREN